MSLRSPGDAALEPEELLLGLASVYTPAKQACVDKTGIVRFLGENLHMVQLTRSLPKPSAVAAAAAEERKPKSVGKEKSENTHAARHESQRVQALERRRTLELERLPKLERGVFKCSIKEAKDVLHKNTLYLEDPK